MKTKKIMLTDIIVILAIIANLSAVFLTQAIIHKVSIAGAVASANAIESNPVAHAQQTSLFLTYITKVIFYGMLIGMYAWLRDKSIRSREDMLVLQMFAFILFFAFATDALNDFGIYVGFLINSV